MATARFAWGIDVGNRALKAIRLVRDGDQFKIDDFEVIEHEQILSQAGDNRESLIQTALANFAQRQNFKGGAVAVGVSGQASFARFIKLPPVEPKKIPEIVRFEAIQQIPFPLDDVEWAYQLFQNDQSPDVEVGIFAMRKELVNQNIKYFTDVGINVQTVQMNPLAVYNALYHDQRLKGTSMIVDLGAENTDLIIAEGESIWMRSIPIGGNNFTESLVKQFKLKFNKAEELKRNASTSKYGRQILQAMRPVFADLVAEIQRSIGFYSSTHRDSRIARVLALGGTFRLPGLQKYLQQNLQMDVTRVDRLGAEMPADARFASTFNENILSAVSAYGLALQAIGETKIASSLLPEKIRRERMWRDKTKWFAAAAALMVVGTGMYAGRVMLDSYSYDSQKEHRSQLSGIVTRATGFDSRWKQVESSGTDDRKQITNLTGAVADRNILPDLVVDLGRAFPASAQSLEDLKKTPRNQRKVMQLDAWKMNYQPDLGTQLALPTEQFNRLADTHFESDNKGTRAAFGATDAGAMDAGGGLGGLNSRSRRASTGRNVQRMKVVVPSDNPSALQRGMIVTIRCRTPNSVPASLVKATAIKALLARNQDAADAPQNYSIVRVETAEVRKIQPTDRPADAVKSHSRRKVMPMARGGAGGMGFRTPAGGRPGEAFNPFEAIQPQGDPAEKVDPWEDPLIPGESMQDDWIITLVAAIQLDPPPKPKENKDSTAASAQ